VKRRGSYASSREGRSCTYRPPRRAEALTRELHRIIQNDPYPRSPRIVALREILGQLSSDPPLASPCLHGVIMSPEQGDGRQDRADANTVRLTHAEWNELVALIKREDLDEIYVKNEQRLFG
jgi:hypothetical protein